MPYDRSAFVTRTAQQGVAFDFMVDQTQLIADAIFTPKPGVEKRESKVYQFDVSKLRLMETRKKTNQEADLVDEQLFTRNITLEEHKLGREINPLDLRDADIPALLDEARAIRMVTLQLLLKREALAATLATTAANYMAALTSAIASGSRWNEAGGDPEADKVTADNAIIDACGRPANALSIGGNSLRKLITSPAFRSRTQYTNAGPVTLEQIKAFFHVDYLFVGDARYVSSVEGATDAKAEFWSDNAIFHVYNPSPSLEDVSFGHMYMKESPFWTNTLVDEKRRGPAGPMKRVEVGTEYVLDKGFVESSSSNKFAAGYLFRTCVA